MGPHLSTGIEGYFSDAARVSWTAKGLLYSSQTLVLDAVVVRGSCVAVQLCSSSSKKIYRGYVVWQSVFVIVVPMLGWIGLLSTLGQ